MAKLTPKNKDGEEVNWLDWMATRLVLKDKQGKLVKFIPNRIQSRLLGIMIRQRQAGLPVRIIILKARQEGCSTLVQLLYLTLVQNEANMNAFVCAHDEDASTTVFRKAQLAERYIPDEEQRPKQFSNRKELVWKKPHNSQFRVQSAGNKDLDAGGTNQLIHISELARWAYARMALLSLMQTLPDGPETMCVIESTAQGEGGEFHKRWLNAMEGQRKHPGLLDSFIPVFFSWMDDPTYSRRIPKGYKWGNLDEDELELRKMGATQEQLYWRRWTIENKCGGDKELFMQEYPSTPEEAFLASGRHAIMAKIRKQHRKTCEQPKYARLEWIDEAEHTVAVKYEDYAEGAEGLWRIYREPVQGRDYAIGGDVAEGILSDPNDPKSDPDNSAATVLDRSDLFTVAVYVGRPEPRQFGIEMEKAAYWYNAAWQTPEINNNGVSTLDVLKEHEYERIAPRDMPIDITDPKEPKRLGWRTTPGNRERLVAEWIDACRPDSTTGYTHCIQVLSHELANEEDTFVIDERGKRAHKTGEKDDILFSAMIALQVHKMTPRERKGFGPDEYETVGGVPSYMYIGGRDPGPDAELAEDVVFQTT